MLFTRRPQPAPDASSTPDAAEAARVVGAAQPLLEVAASQLRDVVAQTESAALGVMSGAGEADSEAGALTAFARELGRRAGDDAERVAGATRANAEAVEQLVRLVTERDTAVLDLVEEVRGLSRYVESIAEVARATTILALNAKVEAARAGAAGLGFSVVADEVGQLSHRSATAAEDVRHGIARVTALMEQRLGQGGDDPVSGSDAINEQLRAIAAAQRDTAEELTATVAETGQAIHRVESVAGTLSARTTGILAHAQFQDITRQTVESVIRMLDGLGARLSLVGRHLRGQEDAEALRRLDDALQTVSAAYTSQRERAVHAGATGGVVQRDGAPTIELF